MAQCERLPKCPFFNDQMANMPSVSELMKQTYCMSDKTQCARFQVGAAGKTVPADLFPHDTVRARRIING